MSDELDLPDEDDDEDVVLSDTAWDAWVRALETARDTQ